MEKRRSSLGRGRISIGRLSDLHASTVENGMSTFLVFLSCIYTARCYASAVLAMALCLSVRHKSEFY